jgi:cobalt-zinc-cadmium efflux system outer membrane protein
LSETAVAFYEVLSGQRRVAVYDGQIVALDRILPLLARRVDLGASSPAEIARARLAIELIRAERERARTEIGIARRELANLMGTSVPDFSQVVGELNVTGRPPAFQTVLDALDRNPQLIRWTAVRAQRDAELLSARLKPIPDLRLEAGWRRYRETKDSSYRLGVSIPIPVWDQNQGAIYEAQESLAKTSAERATNKTVLVLTLGRAYENLTGALRELQVLRTSAIPNARIAVEGTETGYTQGRYTLFELLDAQSAAMQAELRVQEVLLNFYTAVAIIEGLTGNPFTLARARSR